jgi:hypothetical protein
MKTDEPELYRACKIVERHLRAIGDDCQVITAKWGVEVAPLSWSGSATGEDLYSAIIEALEAVEK